MLSAVISSALDALAWCSSPGASRVLLSVWLRALALMLAWACGTLAPQSQALAGHRGMHPAQTRLHRIRADFSPVQGFLRFPSLLHCFASLSPRRFDNVLPTLLWIGAASGLASVFGVIDSRIGLAMCWIIYLSYANMVHLLIYPWDHLLLEATFLSLFLPPLPPLWSSSAASLSEDPLPLVTWSLRWLLFRLMAGFGRMKFSGCSLKEFSYLKGFMINMPLPTVVGWAMHSLPLTIHKLALALFFVSECIVPFGFVFLSGPWRIGCALATMFLQANIQLSGNFGWFNTLSALLCIPCLDGSGALSDTTWADISSAPLTHLLLGGIIAPLSLFYCVFNSWCTMSFAHWPSINWPPTRVGEFLRVFAPWHMLHSYGIFFPQSSPGVRFVPVIEGTSHEADGLTPEQESALEWKPYIYKFMTVSPFRRPPFVAPRHVRFDQAIFYDAVGLVPDTFTATLSSGDPYAFQPENRTMLQRVAQSLLLDQSPGNPIEDLFATNPFPSASRPVRAVRISLYLFAPTSFADVVCGRVDKDATTGAPRYWNVKAAGSQVPGRSMTRKRLLSNVPLPTPEADQRNFYRLHEPSEWHPEHFLLQTATTQYARLTDALDGQLVRAAGGRDGEQVDLEAILQLRNDFPAQVDASLYGRFWSDFLPRVRAVHERMVASTACAQAFADGATTTSKGACPCACLTCRFRSDFASGQAQQRKGAASLSPVLNWGAEVSVLRSNLLRGNGPSGASPAFSTADLFFFKVLTHRLTMLLTHRVLGVDGLYHGVGPDEQRGDTDESEAAQKVLESRTRDQAAACPGLCRCAHAPSPSLLQASDPRARLAAPSLELNFGLPAPLIGARAKCTAQDHIHVPSFFHLHLLLQHALLSCSTPDAFVSLLLSPREVVPLQSSFSLSSGLLLPGVWNRDLLAFHGRKVRLARVMTFPHGCQQGGLLPGFLNVYFEFLQYQFVPNNDNTNIATQGQGEEDAEAKHKKQTRATNAESCAEANAMWIAPEHWPTRVQRPMRSDEFWRVDMSGMPEPTVDLAPSHEPSTHKRGTGARARAASKQA